MVRGSALAGPSPPGALAPRILAVSLVQLLRQLLNDLAGIAAIGGQRDVGCRPVDLRTKVIVPEQGVLIVKNRAHGNFAAQTPQDLVERGMEETNESALSHRLDVPLRVDDPFASRDDRRAKLGRL